MIIRDSSTGKSWDINPDGFGAINAFTSPLQYFANIIRKDAYSAIISETPTGVGDCFFYIKNICNYDLILTSLSFYAAAAETIQMKLGDIGTVGGTHAELLPSSRNAGSGKTADVTCESGVDITGLSGGVVVDQFYATAEQKRVEWGSRIIVPKNAIMSLYAVTGAISIGCTLGFFTRGLCV